MAQQQFSASQAGPRSLDRLGAHAGIAGGVGSLLGGGATVQPGDIGLTGSGGFGMKFYLTQWLALRLDVRDFVHEQKRVALGVEKIVNDITATGGFSVFIPFTN